MEHEKYSPTRVTLEDKFREELSNLTGQYETPNKDSILQASGSLP